jgi:hypothetical protein
MIKKNYLLLLTETERSMAEEALTHYIQNPFLGSGNWISIDAREKVRKETTIFLVFIKNFVGGIKKEVSESNLHFLQEALLWYSNFIPDKKETNEYRWLGHYIKGRNNNIHLFNIDPQSYNPNQAEPIRKKDFSKPRYLIVRKTKGKLDYVSEVIQKSKETSEKYEIRAKEKLKQNAENPGKWMLIKNTELENFEIDKKCSYFCFSPNDF